MATADGHTQYAKPGDITYNKRNVLLKAIHCLPSKDKSRPSRPTSALQICKLAAGPLMPIQAVCGPVAVGKSSVRMFCSSYIQTRRFVDDACMHMHEACVVLGASTNGRD